MKYFFNPRSGGVDFVEIYNRSPKYINLKNWKLGNFENNSVLKPQVITTEDFILAPSGYIAFTSDPASLISQYPQAVQKIYSKQICQACRMTKDQLL